MSALQIRDMPDDAHRKLKARAASAGMSLSEYALAELLKSLEKPTHAELLERIKARPAVDLPPGLAADMVREGHGAR